MGKVGSVLRVLGLTVLLALTLTIGGTLRVNAQPQIPSRMPDWSTPDEVIDLAVSADGSIIAVATAITELGTITEGWLNVYSASGNLLWQWGGEDITVTAVDVSEDGNVVVAAICNATNGYYLFFWKNAKELSGLNPTPDWSSGDLFGWIGPEALAISSDGNHVIAVGTGPNIFYWNDTLKLSGGNTPTTWNMLLPNWLEYADISDDGDVVAILGSNRTDLYPQYYAFVYKNCRSRTGSTNPPDLEYGCGGSDVHGSISLSDDGMYLVAGVSDRIYFFNTTMSAPWDHQWIYTLEKDERIVAVDISSDGDTVVAVTNLKAKSPSRLLIFQNASSKKGVVGSADHEFNEASSYTGHDYSDASVDGLGSLAVGGTGDYVFAVNATTGEPLWYYNGTYPLVSRFVKVSEDGSAVVTAGGEIDSLYYFKLVVAPPPVGGIIISPRENLTATSNNIVMMILTIALISALTIAAKRKLRK